MMSFQTSTILVVLVLLVAAESAKMQKKHNPHSDAEKHAEMHVQQEEKAEPSETTRGALGQGFDLHKIDLLVKELQASGSKVFEELDPEECTVTDKLGTTQRDDTFYSSTESLYKSVSTNSKVSASLKGAYTLGASVSAVTNNIDSGNTEIMGLSLNMKALSMSTSLKQECINKNPLAKDLVSDFENLQKEIKDPHKLQSWRSYKVFIEKYGSHIVKESQSGSSIYQYVFAKSEKKFSQRDFTVKACVSLAGPTQAGKVGVSACSGVTKEEISKSSKNSMVKKMVVRGGKADTRADLTGELSEEKINKFMKEGQSDPSPIQYAFYPIWTILKSRYIGKEHFAKAINLEQFYKGYLSFGCSYDKTSNGKEIQKFALADESDPEAPTYVCKLGPEGCHVDDDCHYENAFWCSCSGESCLRYKDTKLNTGTTKKEAYAYTASGWGWQGCERSTFSCYCSDPNKNWEEVWNGDVDGSLKDVHHMLKRRRDQSKRHKCPK